jgi:hypothetical protein
MGTVVALGRSVTAPAGAFDDCLQIKDWSKIESPASSNTTARLLGFGAGGIDHAGRRKAGAGERFPRLTAGKRCGGAISNIKLMFGSLEPDNSLTVSVRSTSTR